MVTKVEGERGKLKGLVEMTKREMTVICRRMEDLSREGEGNKDKITVSRFFEV